MKKILDDLKVIGIVHSPYKTTNDAPRQGEDTVSEIEIFKEYEDGLKDIEGFTNLHVLYWLHKSEGYNLITKTPWDTELHGVFTTRSPHRPNPIAHAVVDLVERKQNILRVKRLDAIEGTPVIDIKPYIKRMDLKNNAISGWAEKLDID
jgi:formylmethanofuran dehydrogenase subunit E